MVGAMQRKSNRLFHPVTVYLRTDLISVFYDLVGKTMKDIGAHYFCHNLINNHGQEGHAVSSFVTHPEWQEKYWNHYWDCDPVHLTSYAIAKINGSALVPWQAVNAEDDCTEDKKAMCKIKNGFTFHVQHNNGVLESFSFGWKKYDANQGNRQNFAKLFHMVREFRRARFKLDANMFGTLLAI